MYGSIELGGTKIRCGIFDDGGNLLTEDRIKTADPYDNVKEIVEFFKDSDIKSIGTVSYTHLTLPTSDLV